MELGCENAPCMPHVLWPYSISCVSEVLVTSQHEYSPFLQYLQGQQATQVTLPSKVFVFAQFPTQPAVSHQQL